MNKLASVVFVVCAACGSKKSENKAESPAANKPTDTTTCPMPTKEGVRERFAVGAVPHYRVNSMAEAPKCHDEFVASDVVKIENGQPKLVAEGTFQGHCPGEPSSKDTFEAVKPDKAVIEISATHTNLGGELGLGKPVILDSKQPDKHVGVTARVVDRCGTPLSLGLPGDITTWKIVGDGCDKIAKVRPYGQIETVTADKGQEMEVVALGPGTCTLTAELLGVSGETPITVK